MKIDNMISKMGKIKEKANELIIEELNKRGHVGLAPSHGDILSTLIFHGNMTKKEISNKINRKQSTVTTLISKLEKLGYLSSQVNLEDARSIVVSLTEKGYKMKNDFIEISEMLYKIQYKGMTEDQIEKFKENLDRVYKNFVIK
ncbi:MarR family winged helix-turn-helix transcriptional regulator [Helicovermis profundi]|uniref:MarR family transcriptional regulator n=1 Tax=Helicovermis profundi TaxID=3065157 RepID=A0AAU9E4C4_9FIRM|nr:MarR family transcriptional regulator [Clostridia bacterium S502]